MNGALWIPATGCPWRDLPERYRPSQACYHRFGAWAKDGTGDWLYAALLARIEQRRGMDWERWCIDATSIRAMHAAADARTKGGPLPNRLTTRGAGPAAAGARSRPRVRQA